MPTDPAPIDAAWMDAVAALEGHDAAYAIRLTGVPPASTYTRWVAEVGVQTERGFDVWMAEYRRTPQRALRSLATRLIEARKRRESR